MPPAKSEKRLKAFSLYMDGYDPKEIVSMLEVSSVQVRQWKMLDKWEQCKEDDINGKEMMLVLLSAAREGERNDLISILKKVCETLIQNGYTKHGETPAALFKWINSFIHEVEKIEAWNWIKYELWGEKYMDNETIWGLLDL